LSALRHLRITCITMKSGRPHIGRRAPNAANECVQMTRGCDLRCPAMDRRPGGGSTEMPHSTGEFGVVNRFARIHVKYLGQRRRLSLCDRLRALVDHVTGISGSGRSRGSNRDLAKLERTPH